MVLLTNELIQELLEVDASTCISLYMPTHQNHPDNLQDVIVFKKLLKQLEDSLLLKYSADETNSYLAPIKALENDDELWNHTLEGLAVFSAKGLFKVIGLYKSVEKLAMVADSFHTKPLRQYLQTRDNFHVLCLTRHDIRLFAGNRHRLYNISLRDVPSTIEEALGSELTDKHTTVASYGGTGSDGSPMHHGHGGKKEETDKDDERFFRVVADAIYEHYSKAFGWPLILAALPEHHHLFHKVNKNPMLLKKGIQINPSSISPDKLASMSWEIMEPEYLLKLDSLVERFGQERANGKGSDDYKEVAVAAVEGRVDTLIVEADRIIAARVTNLVTGNTQKKDLNNPRVDDLLDDLSELVTKMGGQVMVIPKEKMPSDKGLAAIYRY